MQHACNTHATCAKQARNTRETHVFNGERRNADDRPDEVLNVAFAAGRVIGLQARRRFSPVCRIYRAVWLRRFWSCVRCAPDPCGRPDAVRSPVLICTSYSLLNQTQNQSSQLFDGHRLHCLIVLHHLLHHHLHHVHAFFHHFVVLHHVAACHAAFLVPHHHAAVL